jgi:hypothetical protein
VHWENSAAVVRRRECAQYACYSLCWKIVGQENINEATKYYGKGIKQSAVAYCPCRTYRESIKTHQSVIIGGQHLGVETGALEHDNLNQ